MSTPAAKQPAERKFASRKFQLIEAGIADPSLPRLAMRVHVLLASKYLDEKTDTAWPAPETLAEELSVTVRGVRDALAKLAGGWWQKTKGGGRGNTSRYAPRWERVHACSLFQRGKTVNASSANSEQTRTKTVNGSSPDSVYEIVNDSDRPSDLQNSPSNTAVGRSRQVGENVANSTAVNARQCDQEERRHRVVAGNSGGGRDDGDGENFDAWKDHLVEKRAFTDESYGYGAGRAGASDAVDRLRSSGGDAAAIRCLEDGRAKGLFGPVLRRHVESRAKYFEDRHQRAAG
jgi:hypothetical protein